LEAEELSERIRSYRLRNGLSQEQLAQDTGLNIRTIQRIENGETVPRGDSLRRLSSALKTTPEAFVGAERKEDKAIIGILSFSQLAFIVFPLFGVALPVIIWLIQKDKVLQIEKLGRRIINFQTTWLLIVGFIYTFTIFTKILHLSIGIRGVFLTHPLIFLYAYNLLIVILNSLFALKGKKVFYVPAFRFLRKTN
jgi:transcriptional regulator with XRE-family HTH domain